MGGSRLTDRTTAVGKGSALVQADVPNVPESLFGDSGSARRLLLSKDLGESIAVECDGNTFGTPTRFFSGTPESWTQEQRPSVGHVCTDASRHALFQKPMGRGTIGQGCTGAP